MLITILIIPIQTFAYTLDKRSNEDTFYQLIYTTLRTIDWGQTRTTAKNPSTHIERNPILGEHPTIGEVNTYFITTLLGHAYISYVLPSKYRRIWQAIWIGQSAQTITRNYIVGVKITF